MKLAVTLLLLLIIPCIVCPQTKPALEQKVKLEFGDAEDRIIAYRFVPGENKLVLVGRKIVSVLDVESLQSERRSIEIAESERDRAMEISPDGRRVVLFQNAGSSRKGKKLELPPSVWDLQTGKQVALLDKTSKPIRSVLWSKNGKILATSSDRYAPLFTDSTPIEVAFWDGETFEYKNSLPSDRVGWWHLTDDGQTCIYSTGEVKGFPLLIPKYVTSTGPISTWNISEGRLAQHISNRAGNVERKVKGIQLSTAGSFLSLVLQPTKAKDTHRSLSVWEIREGSNEMELSYEFTPGDKTNQYDVIFSPSGKFFSLEVGKTLQIYETRTGEKRAELSQNHFASAWLNDEIIYNHYVRSMKAFDAFSGKFLYEQPLIYSDFTYTPVTSYDSNDTGFNLPVTEVTDHTRIVPHPSGRMFLTYSNQYVKVFDSRTGEQLHTLVSPSMDYTKKKPRLSNAPLVYKAEWSGDGTSLYIIGADKRTISLWKL